MSNIVLDQIQIRVDAHGRYCLNDLHKAAIAAGKATESHAPAQFLKTGKVQAFVSVLDAEDQCEENPTAQNLSDVNKITSVHSIKGGKLQGTYAVELVAIRYAAWIDPAFEVRVYKAFQKAVKGDGDRKRLRHMAASSSKLMAEMLQDVRRAIGKGTESHHFANEHRLINYLLTGEYKGLYRDTMPVADLDFLAHFEIRNAVMLGNGLPYEQRKGALLMEAMAYKEAKAFPGILPMPKALPLVQD